MKIFRRTIIVVGIIAVIIFIVLNCFFEIYIPTAEDYIFDNDNIARDEFKEVPDFGRLLTCHTVKNDEKIKKIKKLVFRCSTFDYIYFDFEQNLIYAKGDIITSHPSSERLMGEPFQAHNDEINESVMEQVVALLSEKNVEKWDDINCQKIIPRFVEYRKRGWALAIELENGDVIRKVGFSDVRDNDPKEYGRFNEKLFQLAYDCVNEE